MEYTLQKVNWGNTAQQLLFAGQQRLFFESDKRGADAGLVRRRTGRDWKTIAVAGWVRLVGDAAGAPGLAGAGRRKGHLQPLAEGSATTGMPGCPDVYWHQKCPQPGTGGTVWPFACGNLHRRYGKNS